MPIMFPTFVHVPQEPVIKPRYDRENHAPMTETSTGKTND